MAWPTEAGSLLLLGADGFGVCHPTFGGEVAQPPRVLAHRHGALRGRYRIFNAVEWRFYWNATRPPAEGDTPDETAASLPTLSYTSTATFADGVYYVAMTYFNGVYDSGFLPIGDQGESYRLIEIVDGEAVGNPPQPPGSWRIELASDRTIRIVASYWQSGSERADEWVFNFAQGTTPPVDEPMTIAGFNPVMPEQGLCIIYFVIPVDFSDSTTINARLQTRRNDGTEDEPVWVYSDGGTVQSLIIDYAAVPGAARGIEMREGSPPAGGS